MKIVRVCWPEKQAEAGRDAGFDSESRRSLHWHLQPEAARPVAWALCLAVLKIVAAGGETPSRRHDGAFSDASWGSHARWLHQT